MTKFIGNDFVRLRREPQSRSKVFLTLAFGDAVEVVDHQDGFVKLRALTHFDGSATGWTKNNQKLQLRDTGVLKFSMVDVQQGDGLIMETPSGKIVLFDGGDNKLFARHLAARFRHRASSPQSPLPIDAMIVTHGDADHFDGLNDIKRSEEESGIAARKRIFIHPQRVFHNGLVKQSSSKPGGGRRKDVEMFGATLEQNGETYAIDLHENLLEVPDARMNLPFKRWKKSLQHWSDRGPIEFRRIALGDDTAEVFDFLEEEGIEIDLHGPVVESVRDPQSGEDVPALRFFRAPKKSPDMHLREAESGSVSASHTVNGHSIAMRIRFGGLRLYLTGDLNRPAMQLLQEQVPKEFLESEIIKAPHHGSADFDFEALAAMRPVVAIISSGDESSNKEHIHPRATLMAALGKVMRENTGIIFNTELAAFFHKRDFAHKREDLKKFFSARKNEVFTGSELADMFTGKLEEGDPESAFYAFERTNFGIIHIRSDGEKVLVFTHSGKKGMNEAYVFTVRTVDGTTKVKFAKKAVVH
ncbi:MBL fold metallo-hydrolase [Pelagibius sp.]|uniref:MBL fold metallo-hydrolase n=1 Tax=Pelagibius sp. TaxID=1931238 RepID=UPI002613047B|nr:MBL fold metallo-hydrolase [Pelagibius sp.]